jgi:hypothetical protein
MVRRGFPVRVRKRASNRSGRLAVHGDIACSHKGSQVLVSSDLKGTKTWKPHAVVKRIPA